MQPFASLDGPENKTRCRTVTASSRIHAYSSQNIARQRSGSVRITNPPLFMAIDEMAFHSSAAPLTGYTPSGSSFIFLNRKGSWTPNPVIMSFAAHGACVTASPEWSLEISTVLDLFSHTDFASATCFMMDKIAFHKSSLECNSVHLCMQRTAYSTI